MSHTPSLDLIATQCAPARPQGLARASAWPTLIAAATLALVTAPTGASVAIRGEVHRFQSPGRVTETCVALAKMPGGVYSAADKAMEKALCAINIYDRHVAVCPKLRSTSPGTFVYQLTEGALRGRPEGLRGQGLSARRYRGQRSGWTAGELQGDDERQEHPRHLLHRLPALLTFRALP